MFPFLPGMPENQTPDPNGAKADRERFYVCPVCGERVDWRDPLQVLKHADHATPPADLAGS